MQTALDALILSSLYALIGAGYVVIYRSSRVLNLALGDMMALGGFLFFGGATLGLGLVPSAAFAIAVSALTGALIYGGLIRPLSGRTVFSAVLITIAVGIVLRAVIQLIWGNEIRKPLAEFGLTNDMILIGDAGISTIGLVQVLAAVAVIGGTLVALRWTRWGMQTRAVAESMLLASHRGVSVNVMLALSWAIAGGVAAVAGILYGLNVQLTGNMANIGLAALAVPLMAGLTSLGGVIPAAAVIGGLETVVAHHGDPLLAQTIPFLIILAVIVVRPWGLFGIEEELARV